MMGRLTKGERLQRRRLFSASMAIFVCGARFDGISSSQSARKHPIYANHKKAAADVKDEKSLYERALFLSRRRANYIRKAQPFG